MKITNKKDRIRLQAENRAESQAVLAIHDLIFHGACDTWLAEDIANDSGCKKFPDGEHYNYCSIPHAKPLAESMGLCAASREEN